MWVSQTGYKDIKKKIPLNVKASEGSRLWAMNKDVFLGELSQDLRVQIFNFGVFGVN